MEDSPYVNAPYLGTYFYLLNTNKPPLDDVRVRQALSLAVDREKLNNTVLHGTNVPAYGITPPGTLGYQPPRVFDYDVEKARKLLAEAGYPDGAGWPGLELTYNTSESHLKIAVALQQMWKDALNIDVTLANPGVEGLPRLHRPDEFPDGAARLDRRLRGPRTISSTCSCATAATTTPASVTPSTTT
jgi:oligopeptide transport system substrate-binding protein